jgi:hypothetical protein
VIGLAIAGNPENDGHLSPWQDRRSSDDLRDLGPMGLSLYRVRAILSNHNECCRYHNLDLVRKGASMPTQRSPCSLPQDGHLSPCRADADRAGNPLIYRILCAILRAISVAGRFFSLLSGRQGARRSGWPRRRRARAAVQADPQQPHRPQR